MWRETPFYSERERAALAWAEALTLVHQTHAPDDLYEEVRKRFTEEEVARHRFPRGAGHLPAGAEERGLTPYSWSATRRTVTRRFFTSGMPAVAIGPRLAAWMRASWMPLSMRKRRTASTRRWLSP